jgi:outer membrane protein assembly factor BamB
MGQRARHRRSKKSASTTAIHSRARRTRFEQLESRELLSANVLTYHNDQASTGANLQETALAPADVNQSQFGKLATVPVDGQVYAQPLYMENIAITTGTSASVDNVVFVATEHDSVYAIDSASGKVLWQTSFINPSQGISTVPAADVIGNLIGPEIGITATPVIDPSTNTIYVVAATKEVRGDGNHYVWTLHALDLSTGQEQYAALTIGDTLYDGTTFTFVSGPSVAGNGGGSVNGRVTFNAVRQLERPALTLVDHQVFMAFGSYSDIQPAHGWVMAAAVTQNALALVAAVNLSPNGSLADVWAAGAAVTYDGAGGFYASTGNGTFDTTLDAAGFPAEGDYGDSIVKLAWDPNGPSKPNINGYGLNVVGYFTPADQQSLADLDLDLGSGGTVLFPATAGSAADPNLLVEGSKAGTVYLLNRDNLTGFNPTTDQALAEIPIFRGGADGTAVFLNTPAYFNGMLYIAGSGDALKALPISQGSFGPVASQSPDDFGDRGGIPSISANGTANGIVWIIDPASNQIRAYDAANVARELYTSDQAPARRDQLGQATKFSLPTVADGQVFVGTTNSLVIYGLLPATNSPTDRYIAAAYYDVLGRPVDPASLAFWNGLLVGNSPSALLASTLVQSAEYDAIMVVTPSYERFLGRPPDPAGLAWWVAQLQKGFTDEQLTADFVGSPEFYSMAGGTDESWIDAVYRDLLGRSADPQGETYWLAQLAGGESRYSVAYALAAAAESEERRIVEDYQHYLDRSPDGPAIGFWLAQVANGMTDEDRAAAFVASQEYYQEHV